MAIAFVVATDKLFVADSQDSLIEWLLGSFFKDFVDFLDRRVALCDNDKVTKRHNGGWNAHAEAAKDTLKRWQCLRCCDTGTGCCRDNIFCCRTRFSQILGRCILEFLAGGIAMDGCHHRFFDAKILFEHGHHRRDAVGRTAGVAHDIGRVVDFLIIHAKYDCIRTVTLGRSRDDHLFSPAAINMRAGELRVDKEASALNHDINAKITPR